MRGEARREVPADGPGAEDYDAHRASQGFPNVAMRSIRQMNSTRFSSMPGSRKP
jgi:hypothetical protein